jgi:ubiquinone/menaquinone biosynthesis C-methylase UbiE
MSDEADFTDFARAGNQGGDPAVYELENAALDPDDRVFDAMRELAPWAGRTLLDLGCGSGFWLPRYATEAGRVIGVEPDPTLLPLARARPGGAEVLRGSAEQLPLPDASVDVAHARSAYFFPPDIDAGLAEVRRVLRPREQGASRTEVMSSWRFDRRADLEAVLQLEFPAEIVEPWLSDHPDALELSYGYVLFTVTR